jgi:hypothetical protein
MPIQLQSRDFLIFGQLQSCRFLTLGQVADLCFEGRREAAKKRLRKLQQGALLLRHSQGMNFPSIFMMTKQTYSLLDQNTHANQRFHQTLPALTTLRHEILIRDFRAALFRNARSSLIEISVFTLNCRELKFQTGGSVLRSDGYFEVKRNDKVLRYFLEVDLGSESHSVLLNRVQEYQTLYKSGLLAARLQAGREHFRRFPFRVLFLFLSEARLQSFLLKLYEIGCRDFVLANTFPKVLQGPLKIFWHAARSEKERSGLEQFCSHQII